MYSSVRGLRHSYLWGRSFLKQFWLGWHSQWHQQLIEGWVESKLPTTSLIPSLTSDGQIPNQISHAKSKIPKPKILNLSHQIPIPNLPKFQIFNIQISNLYQIPSSLVNIMYLSFINTQHHHHHHHHISSLIHCNLVIMLTMGAKWKEHYNEMSIITK